MAIMEAIRTPRLQIARLRHDILVTGERYPGREEVVGHIVCQYSQMLLHLRIADVLFQPAAYFVGTDINGYLCQPVEFVDDDRQGVGLTEREPEVMYRIPGIWHHTADTVPHADVQHPRIRMNLQDGHQQEELVSGGFICRHPPQTACGQYIRLRYLHIFVFSYCRNSLIDCKDKKKNRKDRKK